MSQEMEKVNSVHLVGKVTESPIIRKNRNGKTIVSIVLSVTGETTMLNGSGTFNQVDLQLQAFGTTADIAANYVHKDGKIAVEGLLINDMSQKGGLPTPTSAVILLRDLLLLGRLD